jgi:hypothetical protein
VGERRGARFLLVRVAEVRCVIDSTQEWKILSAPKVDRANQRVSPTM